MQPFGSCGKGVLNKNPTGRIYDLEQEAAADELSWRHPNPMSTKEGRNAAQTRTANMGLRWTL